MAKKLTLNKNLFLELLNIPKENIIIETIIPNEYIQIGFATKYSSNLEREMGKIFNFYDVEVDFEEGFEFTAVYHKNKYEDKGKRHWQLGYTIFNGLESLEIDELLGTELDNFCYETIKGFLEEKETFVTLDEENKRELNYAGVDMSNWNFSFDENDDKLIYKAFVALCNYAEEFILCGKCPLYGKLCGPSCGEDGTRFWEKIHKELENVEL